MLPQRQARPLSELRGTPNAFEASLAAPARGAASATLRGPPNASRNPQAHRRVRAMPPWLAHVARGDDSQRCGRLRRGRAGAVWGPFGAAEDGSDDVEVRHQSPGADARNRLPARHLGWFRRPCNSGILPDSEVCSG